MMLRVRAVLAIAAAIGAAFATLGGAATVAICQLLGLPAVVTAFGALGGGALCGAVGVCASLVLPVRRPWDPSGAVLALRDLLAGRAEEVRLPLDAPEDLLVALRDLAARLAEDRRGALARESDLRETTNKDVRTLKSALKKLQAENDTLEKRFKSSNSVRDAFLARMSHELRTPLNAILGYVELLLDDAMGEARADLDRVRSAALNLLAIVTTVLDLTQLQSGDYDIQPERIVVAGLVQQVVDSVRISADANGNRIVSLLDPQLEGFIDRRMLQSVLFNLASNACKYTASGTITISGRALGDRLLLEVRDTGIGMTQRQIDEAFRPFAQADESLTRRYDGAGLGLSVVRGFVEAMGGEVRIESAPGKGATVTVDLPLEVVGRRASGMDEDEPTMLLR
jgi:signal transduction histidine kinase